MDISYTTGSSSNYPNSDHFPEVPSPTFHDYFHWSFPPELNKEKFKWIKQADLEQALQQGDLDQRLISYLSDDHFKNLQLASLPRGAIKLLCNVSSNYETVEEKQRKFTLIPRREVNLAIRKGKIELKSYFRLLSPEGLAQEVNLLGLSKANLRAFDEALGNVPLLRRQRILPLLNRDPDLFLNALKTDTLPKFLYPLLPKEFFSKIPLSELTKKQINLLFPDYEKTRFQMLSAEEIEKAIGKNLLSPKHYNLLSIDQISKLHLSRFQQFQIRELLNNCWIPNLLSYVSSDELNLMIANDVLPPESYHLIPDEKLPFLKISLFYTQEQLINLIYFYPHRVALLDPAEIRSLILKDLFHPDLGYYLSKEQIPYDLLPSMAPEGINILLYYNPKEKIESIPPDILNELIKGQLLIDPRHIALISDEGLSHLDLSLLSTMQLLALFPLPGNQNLASYYGFCTPPNPDFVELKRRFSLIPKEHVIKFVQKELSLKIDQHPLFKELNGDSVEARISRHFLFLCSRAERDLTYATIRAHALSQNSNLHRLESALDRSLH